MRRRFVILAAVLAAGGLLVAGCGSSSPSGASSAAPPGGSATMSATQILGKVSPAMDAVKSCAFTGDFTVAVKADAAKLTDPQAQALTQSPINLHVEGKASDKSGGNKADVSMSVQAGGQNVAFGVKAQGNKVWLQFMGKWYAVPASKTKSVTGGSSSTADQSLTKLGIDPKTWVASNEVTGTEQLDGATVYHIVAKADPKQVTADLVKALNDPSLMKAAGSDAAMLEQLKSQNAQQLKDLEKSLTSATVEFWVDASSFYLRKGKLAATMTFTGDVASQGLKGATVDMTLALSAFNEPVTVTPPAHALPFKQLTNGLFNMVPSGLGGATGI